MVCTETSWMASGSHICMFKKSFFTWKISSLNIFCVFVFLFRAHFRISCMSEINMQESKSKFWHLLYFSHISIDWFQIFACLVQECESEIMFSVSTLSTLKYLQKETHYLNDSTENFAFSAFQDQIFFISVLSRFVPRSKPNDQNLGSATWHLCTVCPKPNDQEAQQATHWLGCRQLCKVWTKS